MNVLIAVDGSSNGAVVMESVAPLLRQAGGKAAILTVLDVKEVKDLSTGGWYGFTPRGDAAGTMLDVKEPARRVIESRDQAITRLQQEIGRHLEEMAKEHLAGVEYEIIVSAAEDAAAGIAEEAFQWGADLIVMGTHGRSGFRRALLGSVAESVARNSPIPVFLVSAGMRDEKARAGAR